MSLTMSDILYSYTRLKIDLKEEWFSNSDKQLKGFVANLIKVPREEIKDINSWCGVDIHTPISKIAFENKLYTSLFTEKVNMQNLQNSAALLQGDWAFLQEQFPDLAGLPRETKLKTADQFDDEESTYKPFFSEWDKVFYGLLPGDLIYLFSLPKFGKSSVAAHWAYMGLANGYKVGFYNTELDSKTTQKAIFGYNKSLKYNEAMVFFQKHPHEYKLIKEKFGKNLVMPPNLVFEWAVLEDMYKAGCDLVIVDNQVSCLASLGIEESPQSMGELTRKFSTMQKKYCFAPDTGVLMSDGTVKEIRDIQIGDYVLSPKGTPTKVINFFTGHGKLYRVRQSKGEDYTVSEGHTMVVDEYSNYANDKNTFERKHIVIEELIRLQKETKNGRYKYQGVHTGWDLTNKTLKVGSTDFDLIPPYLLGLWLGDGHSATGKITMMQKDWDEIKFKAEYYGYQINETLVPLRERDKNQLVSALLYRLHLQLKNLNLLNNKHIPEVYLNSSKRDRLELLAGLIDSDGHRYVQKNKALFNRYSIISNFPALADDLKQLLYSLGLNTKEYMVKSYALKYKDNLHLYSNITFTGALLSEMKVCLDRKDCSKIKGVSKFRHEEHCTLDIEELDDGDFVGITLEGSDKTFLLKDGTVVHNCIPTIIVTQEAAREASTKELETDPNRLEYGKGTTRSSRAPIQECFDKNTEVLTQEGWKLIKDIVVNEMVYQYEKGKLELVTPTNYLKKPFDGFLDSYTGTYVDLVTTPNHRHILRDPFLGEEYEILSKDIRVTKDHKFINTGTLTKEEELLEISDNVLKLLVAVQADGNYHIDGGICFHLKREDKISSLLELLEGFDYHTSKCKDGSTIFNVRKTYYLTDLIKKLLPNKILTLDLINGLSTRQLRLVGEEVFKWDGREESSKNSGRYQSIVKENVDTLQVLYSLIGQKTFQTFTDPPGNRKRLYQLYINHRSDTGLRTCKKTEMLYNDYVYCISVPSTFLLTRRNGKVQVSGNCSLGLRMVKQNSHSLVRNINVVADRYRSKLDPMSSYEITLNNRSEMQVEVMRDAVELAVARAEKQMLEDPIVESSVTEERFSHNEI